MHFGEREESAENTEKAGVTLFKFNLSDWTQTRHRLSAWTETFPTPEYILLRNRTSVIGTETASWSALTPDFLDIKPPLVELLNRFVNSLRDICDINVSRKNWAVFTHPELDTAKTKVFLAVAGSRPRILDLYWRGAGVPADLSRGNLSLSPSGELFLLAGESLEEKPFYPGEKEGWTKSSVFLGKVEFDGDKVVAKLVHMGDFPSLASQPFAWFPGSNGFTVLSSDDTEDVRFWVYSLDENPVDWSKVEPAIRVAGK